MDENKEETIETGIEQTTEKTEASDSLTPDHPRFRDVIAKNHELQEKIEALEAKISQGKYEGEDVTDDERSLRIIEREMKQRGFVTQSEFQNERDSIAFDRLENKFNGSNGYPKFVPVDVVAYAKREGFGRNYEAAYKSMHQDAIIQVEAKRVATQPPQSEKPQGGSKQTETSQITPQDVAQMSDAEYEKNREKILQSVNPKSSV